MKRYIFILFLLLILIRISYSTIFVIISDNEPIFQICGNSSVTE